MKDNVKITLTVGQLKRLVKESVDLDNEEWCVIRLGGSIGDKSTCRVGGDKCSVQKDGLTRDEAKKLAGEYRKMTSPGDRKYYGITYKAVPMSKVRCDVEEAAQDVLPEEAIVEFEDHLRVAQKEVEAAARLVCSSHNENAILAWRALSNMSEDIADVIHNAYKFEG